MVINSSNIQTVYYYGEEINALYKGSSLIWKKEEKKTDDLYGGILARYNVTSTSSSTTVLGNTTNISTVKDLTYDKDCVMTLSTSGSGSILFTSTGDHVLNMAPLPTGQYDTDYVMNTRTVYNLSTNNKRFYNCTELTQYIATDSLVTSSVTDFSYMFYGCSALTSVNKVDTSAATNCAYMFYSCKKLPEIPSLDTSKCTNFSRMFGYCLTITTIPSIDTSLGTNFSYMFSYDTALTSVPALTTSKGTNFEGMFQGCTALSTCPSLNTSKGTSFGYMFYGCTKLTSVTSLDTSLGASLRYMFYNCTSLTEIMLDLSSATSLLSTFYNCKGVVVAQFVNLGKASGLTTANLSALTAWGTKLPVYLHKTISYLFDRASAGYSTCTLTLSTATKALLTDSEIATIAAKGYTLA